MQFFINIFISAMFTEKLFNAFKTYKTFKKSKQQIIGDKSLPIQRVDQIHSSFIEPSVLILGSIVIQHKSCFSLPEENHR